MFARRSTLFLAALPTVGASSTMASDSYSLDIAMLLSHVHVGVSDFDRAFAFYSGVMRELGFVLKFHSEVVPVFRTGG